MNQKEYGQLIKELREEVGLHRDQLANLVKMQLTAIRDIEIGKRKHPTTEELSALAQAFKLTNWERREFFLASTGLHAHESMQEKPPQEEVFRRFLTHVDGQYLPFVILDKYLYILAGNVGFLNLFGWTRDSLAVMFDTSLLNYNLMAIIFGDLQQKMYRANNGKMFELIALKNVQMFRSVTLKYRFRPEFRQLYQELSRRFPIFYPYWQQAVHEDVDEFENHNLFEMASEEHQTIRFMTHSIVNPTPYGELYSFVCVPMNEVTERTFRMFRKGPDYPLYRMANWRP